MSMKNEALFAKATPEEARLWAELPTIKDTAKEAVRKGVDEPYEKEVQAEQARHEEALKALAAEQKEAEAALAKAQAEEGKAEAELAKISPLHPQDMHLLPYLLAIVRQGRASSFKEAMNLAVKEEKDDQEREERLSLLADENAEEQERAAQEEEVAEYRRQEEARQEEVRQAKEERRAHDEWERREEEKREAAEQEKEAAAELCSRCVHRYGDCANHGKASALTCPRFQEKK